MLDSRVAYTLLVGAFAIERLVELGISSRNVRRARARGAMEAGSEHYPAMVALHTALLAACPLEVWLLGRPWIAALGLPMLGLLAGAQALRYWVIHVLDGRWTTRVLFVAGDPLVTRGPFRWLRHPNYLAVAVEVAALPLVHTAWITAMAFSAANAVLLRMRIRAEEALLEQAEVMAGVAEVARAHLGWSGTLATELSLVDVLALDSIRQLTLMVEIENRFRIRLDPADEGGLETVGDLVAAIRRKRAADAR
jgi:methyltransferase